MTLKGGLLLSKSFSILILQGLFHKPQRRQSRRVRRRIVPKGREKAPRWTFQNRNDLNL
jgi:hypothetical protein